MDTTRNILSWVQAVEAFNRGDLEPLNQALDPTCRFEPAGTNRDEIMTAIRGLKEAAGWTAHNVLSLVAEGDLVSTTAQNDFADGSSYRLAALLRFGPNGKITEVRSFEPPEVEARLAETLGIQGPG
jgi:SnoaL-like domain